jgi:hypothetical protein
MFCSPLVLVDAVRTFVGEKKIDVERPCVGLASEENRRAEATENGSTRKRNELGA